MANAAQNELIKKFWCESSSSFAHFQKIQIESASILPNNLAFSLVANLEVRVAIRGIRTKENGNGSLVKVGFQLVFLGSFNCQD